MFFSLNLLHQCDIPHFYPTPEPTTTTTHKHSYKQMAYDIRISRSLIAWESHECVRGLLTLRLRKLSEWGKMGSLQGHALMPDQYFFIWALYVSIIGPSPTVSPRSSLQTCHIGSQQHYARPPPQAHPPLLSAHHADTYSQPPNLWWWRTHCTVCDSLSE